MLEALKTDLPLLCIDATLQTTTSLEILAMTNLKQMTLWFLSTEGLESNLAAICLLERSREIYSRLRSILSTCLR